MSHASYEIQHLHQLVQKTKVERPIPVFVLIELACSLLVCIIACILYGKYIVIDISSILLKKSRMHYLTTPVFQPTLPGY
ncbi:Uncharacterized protein QTN25_005123 [Entamoeba marina]